MYGSAGLLGLHADQVLYSFGGRHLVAAQQKLPPQQGAVERAPTQDLALHRNGRKNLRTSPTSRSGTSMAGKWPPLSNSDQCSLSWSGSIIARTNGWAAKSAHPCGAVLGAPHSVECAVSYRKRAAEAPVLVNQ